MTEIEEKMENMLFDYGTVNRTDYRPIELKDPIPTVYKPKKSCMRIRPPPLKNSHTMTDWKTWISFDLLHQPKDIINTNPWKVQQKYEKPIDTGRKQAQLTRPRRVMTPAVSMDDITDDHAREILCFDMYTSALMKSERDSTTTPVNVVSPFPGLPACAKPIKVRKPEFPYVSPEWRMQTVPWESDQLRSYCDPTRTFWLSRPLSKCRACEQNAIVKSQRIMEKQTKKRR